MLEKQDRPVLFALSDHLRKINLCIHFQDVGFSKEYEELRADNCLDEYTAQDSQTPENRDKNRYPNIVACESRLINDLFPWLYR